MSKPIIENTPKSLARAVLLPLGVIVFSAVMAYALSGDTIADRELGQPDFVHNNPNTVDPESLEHPQRVAIDKSVVPNRIYVADTANNRVLGYRSPAALESGESAELVVGQPDFFSSACGTSASSLCQPWGVAVDSAGNLFVADNNNSRVLGYINPFASLAATGMNAGFSAGLVFGQSGFTAGSCNRGSGAAARDATTLCLPLGVAVDAQGNVYVADQVNNRVLEYNTPLTVTGAPGSGDTTADRVFGQLGSFKTGVADNGGVSANSLFMPADVAVDATGDLYVADQQNSRVLEYHTPLAVTAVHGSGDTTADLVFGTDGSFTTNTCGTGAGGLCIAKAVGIDNAGDIFIADSGRVLEYEPPIGSNPTASRVFGQAGDFSSAGCNIYVEFEASPATLCGPTGVASDSSGDLYIADSNNNRVLSFSPPFGAVPVADLALGQPDTYHDVPNSVDPSAMFDPAGVAIDRSATPNHLYVADSANNRVLGYENAASFLDGAPADVVIGQPDFYSSTCNGNMAPSDRLLCNPQGVSVDQEGNLFVADSRNSRVLEFPSPFESGYTASEPPINVFGQDGSFSTASCNPASGTSLCLPTSVAVDRVHGRVYVVDQPNNRVLGYANPIAANPTASIVIGQANFAGDVCNGKAAAPAARNTLCGPADAAVDGAGNLFVADTLNNRVLEYNFPVASGASAARVFGQGGDFTSSGPNKTGVNADGLLVPLGVAVDTVGNVYIADNGNNRVLEYNTPLKVGPLPGSGDTTADEVFGQANDFTKGGCNLGKTAPSDESLCEPYRVASDSAGNLYVADHANNRVLEYDQPVVAPTPTATTKLTPTPTPRATPSPRPTPTRTPTSTATRTPTPAPTPKPGTPFIESVESPIMAGASFTINGRGFTKGSVVNFFVSTPAGPIKEGPLKPDASSTATQLVVPTPATITLGEGFVAVVVINTDKGFVDSNPGFALLQGSAAAGLPSITGLDSHSLAATSLDPDYAVDNVETTLLQGSSVVINGNGFDTVHDAAVDVFCACPGGKLPTTFLAPGNPNLKSTSITFTLPATTPTGPGSIIVSNSNGGTFSAKSNAVSVPLGQVISVTSVSQTGSTITVDGTGFSTLTVINLFNAQAGGVVNLGGLAADGTSKIPLTLASSDKFTFTRPTGAVAGAAYVQAINPPFVPYTSSGTDLGGGFTLK